MFTTHKNWILQAAGVALCLGLGLSFGLAAVSLAQDDPVEARELEAREALNASEFKKAALLFSEVFEAQQAETEAGNALYWEAFSRFHLNKTSELKIAARLLALQQKQYQAAAMAVEGEALAARIYGELAERGEAMAAKEITEWASEEDLRQETRLAALQSLMRMDRDKAMPVLKKIIMDDSEKNRELRRNAVFIMCRENDQETEDLLIDLLQKETDPEFQSELVLCLSSMESERALDVMIDLFHKTKDPEVAQMTLMSMSRHGGDRVFDFLLDLARSPGADPETRGQALMSLSMTDRDDQVADVLIEILGAEKDLEILEMALMSLSRVDSPKANQALLEVVVRPDVGEEFKSMALHFAARNDQVDMGMLKKIYDGAANRDLKRQVCLVLTRMEDQDAALEMLIEISRIEEDSEIRRDAVFWIGQFDNERAAEYLLEVINQE